MFSTVLVANRGEIACRVITTLKRLGITAVAIFSEADAEAKHVALADRAVCVGPAAAAESYLNIDAVIEAARETGADAIHPGYGFLSENVRFARACAAADITFIGPGDRALEIMGDKIRSKNHVAEAGVPLIQGISEPGLTDEQLITAGTALTFPVLIKPSAGGGGKGMHAVEQAQDLPDALATARRVAAASFGDDTLFIEQLIRSPRHIEVQVLADSHGNVVHLGERECSLQRRHQKIIEEAPSPLLDEPTRDRIGQAAVDTARSVAYVGAGTVEFLVSDDEPEKFYFMEMNTRLQVEHPVTEEVTGVDLVEQQIRIAAGESLALRQEDIALTGHSVEARIYAEDPEAGFMPSTGEILGLTEPGGEGVRVDSGLVLGLTVGTEYDPMLAKVIATGADRQQALSRLHSALGGTVIHGVTTNTQYLQQLTADPDVREGRLDTTMIERKLPSLQFPGPERDHAVAAALFAAPTRSFASPEAKAAGPRGWQCDGWRSNAHYAPTIQVLWERPGGAEEVFDVVVDGDADLRHDENVGSYLLRTSRTTSKVHLSAGANTRHGTQVWVTAESFTGMLTVLDHQAQTHRQLRLIEAEFVEAVPEVRSPMPGTVVSLAASSGDHVSAGARLITVEAMKMEHPLSAPLEGSVRIHVREGETVRLGQVLATVEADPSPDSKDM
ncbi:acetyl/propionyl/methylcrotonyl-CoA carboxylase subunit alpha [Nesterenkonia natronophila]|uniref:biotin carboxylase n=1 Tax=Nesterenkonia natronophila TaxID=2174932 RepID=A0A3A4F2U6_9MICC|nr:biotin carboxylase N-terminal domain-containing protein [Nesterenkonia natronophila]RJN32051.1 ATP-grasp domain-containing protein [Nesterenkonia natronophila]